MSLRLLYLIFVRLVGWLVLLVRTTHTELTDRMLIVPNASSGISWTRCWCSGRRPVRSFVA